MLYLLDNFSLNVLSTVEAERLEFSTLNPATVRQMIASNESRVIGVNDRSRELMEDSLDYLIPDNAERYVFPNFQTDELIVGQRRSNGRGGWRMIWWWIHRMNE